MGDLNRSVKIFIDGTEAANGVEKIKSAIAALEAKLNSLNKSEANYDSRAKSLQKQIESRNRTLENYNKKIVETDRILKNLSGATYEELIAAQKMVQRELKKAIPGTEQYNNALAQNKRVTEAVSRAQAAMRVEVASHASVWSRAADYLNKYIGLAGTVIASITGITMSIRKSVNDYAEVSEAMAQVKKYTGMADEGIEDLNESFKRMDTRTTREKLNELASDAGRLGIKSKEGILEFVDAANIINTALGKDLGADAVKNIGKLAQMFGEEERLGLRGAMLATGSAINEVAMNSSACEPYLVQFTARIAGTSRQAGISQSQIIGYASALDQNMQQVEMAATALQTVILKVYQEPAKFAKIAGKDVKEFTELMKNDANEGVLQLLESLRDRGGLDQLAPLFKEMNLNGVRASGVMNTLAMNVNKIRSEQKLATEAYDEAISVIKEFNVQNNTVQAGLEKARKRFREISIELGKQLQPHMSKLITSTGTLIRSLLQLVSFFQKNYKEIAYTIIVLGTYTAAVKLHTLWLKNVKTATGEYIIIQKLKVVWDKAATASTWLYIAAKSALTGRTDAARFATMKFFGVLKLNPYAALLTAIVAAAGALYLFLSRTDAATAAMEALAKVQQEAISNTVAERTKLESLLSVAQDETRSKDERLEAIKRINAISPEYLGNLKLENINTDKAKKSVDKYIRSLVRLRETRSAENRLNDIDSQMSDLKQEDKQRDTVAGAIKGFGWNLAHMATFGLIESNVEQIQGKLENLEAESVALKEFIEKNIREEIDEEINSSGVRSLDKITSELEAAKHKLDLMKNMLPFEKEKLDYDYDLMLSDVENKIKLLEEEKKLFLSDSSNNGYTSDKETKKAFNLKLKQLENQHNQTLNNLREYKQKENQTEEEFNLFQLGQEKKYYGERLKVLDSYQKSVSDADTKADVQKQTEDTRQRLLETEDNYDKALIKSQEVCRDEMLKAIDAYNTQKKTTLEESLADQAITQEEYNSLILSLDEEHTQNRLFILKNYQQEIEKLEINNGSIQAKAVEDANKAVLDADLKAAKARAKQTAYLEKILPDFKKKFQLSDRRSETQIQLNALQVYYDSKVAMIKKAIEEEKITEEAGLKQLADLQAIYNQAKNNIIRKGEKESQRIKDQYGVQSLRDRLNYELDQLREVNEKKLLLDKDYEKAKFNLARDYAKDRFDYFSDLSYNAISALQNAEIANMEAKYEAEITAAQGNSELIEQLEEEKAQKKLDIEKQYADVNFAMKASQIIADTSVSIMKAFADLGPIAGAIAAVTLGVTGGAQLALANAERQKVKSMTLSGSSSSTTTTERVVTPQRYEGNYEVIGEQDGKTYKNIPFIGEPATGIVRRTALISESGAELIVNAQDLARLQKHINYPLVLSAINDARSNTVPQRKEGNYSSLKTNFTESFSQKKNQGTEDLIKEIKLLIKTMKELNVRAYVVLSDITKAQELKDKSEKPFKKGD